MNIKRVGIITGCVFGALYLLFLILPLILSPVANTFNPQIISVLEESTGYKFNIEKIGIITTPKLTVEIKVKTVESSLPTSEKFLYIDNLKAKLSLLPLLIGKIEIDSISANKIETNLKVRQDGHLLLEEYLPQPDPDNTETTEFKMPLGLKLSNHLPNITVNEYNIKLTDMATKKDFVLSGNKFKISDFILNKKVKLLANGDFTLDGVKQFTFNIKVLNRLMPDADLNDLVFNSQTETVENTNNSGLKDVMNILNALSKTKLTANVSGNLKTNGTFESPVIDGFFDAENITMLVDNKTLPESFVKIKSKGHNIKVETNLYSAENEKTVLNGDFSTGKQQKINMTLKSDVKFNNLIRIINSFAKSFNYNDLETLTATGGFNADFTLKSNMKKVNSQGYLKIPSSTLNYGLYNLKIDNLKADISLDDKVDIKDFEFSLFNQPLKIYGTIEHNADTDIHISAQNMLIKGLLLATGQLQLLKDNSFNSGSVSLNATLSGKLSKLIPDVNIIISNVDVKNIPSATRIVMPQGKIIVNTDGKKYNGDILLSGMKILNPMATVSVPETKVNIGEKDIEIQKADLFINNSKIGITGKIKDYLKDNLTIDINANGAILTQDIKKMFYEQLKTCSNNGKLPVSIKVNGNLKTQKILFNMSANPLNYISIAEIDALKNHSTIINANVTLHDNIAQLIDTGIFIDNTNNPLATLNGNVSDLAGKQKLNLELALPKQISFAIPGFKKSKVVARGDISVLGTVANPHLRGLISVPEVTISDMALTVKNLVLNLNGAILNGNATVKSIRFGEIYAENLASEIHLKNYSTLILSNILGDAFDGKISGNISYDLLKTKLKLSMSGSNMNTLKAVEATAGIKNALTGTLDFSTVISTQGVTDKEIIKNLFGSANFTIKDGKFLNVGRFDNLLYAKNVTANSVLKAAITSVTNQPMVQNTAEFKELSGKISFNNGWAILNSIKTSGPLMAYYVTGKYNILNGTTNVIILGRIDEKVVTLLGPLGDLSVDTFTSYIPQFGSLTSSIIRSMTSNPAKENVANIPALSSGSKNYKDFKVEFNGGIESRSSIKSFKWLTNANTSAIDIKKEVNSAKEMVKSSVSGVQNELKNTSNELKNTINDSKKQLMDTTQELKNLFSF